MGITERARGHRSNNIDVLRLLFACLVLVSHAFELVDGNRDREPLVRLFGTLTLGEIGVSGFFFLSGILITQSWQRRPLAGTFVAKRVARIYPGFLAAGLISLLIVAPLGAADGLHALAALSPIAWLWLLCLHLPAVGGTFPGQAYSYVNGSLWTLPLEFGCYLLLLGFGYFGLLSRRFIVLIVWLAALAALVLLHVVGPASAMTIPIVRLLVMFLAGIACQLFRMDLQCTGWRAIAAAVILVICLAQPELAEIGLSTAGAYLLIFASYARPLPPLFHRLPDVSYGTYLYGWPIQQLTILYCTRQPLLVLAVAVPSAMACGWASWTLVERPALLALERWRGRTSVAG